MRNGPGAHLGTRIQSTGASPLTLRCVRPHVLATGTENVPGQSQSSPFTLRTGAQRQWVRSTVRVTESCARHHHKTVTVFENEQLGLNP